MNILEELKQLKERSEEIELKSLSNDVLEIQVEKILPYAIKHGIENFKNSTIENLYEDVTSFIMDKNINREKELKEKVSSIFQEGHKAQEQFLLGEGEYTGLSIENRISLFKEKWDLMIKENPDFLYKRAYSYPMDDTLSLFNINDNISREEINRFKEAYSEIKLSNTKFIETNSDNNHDSGLDLFKQQAIEIENIIRKHKIRDEFRSKLNYFLLNHFDNEAVFIPFQKEQIEKGHNGYDVGKMTGSDLINSFVRELDEDYILKGENLKDRDLKSHKLHDSNSELVQEIKSVSLNHLTSSQYHSHSIMHLTNRKKSISNVENFYQPTFNLLNTKEKNDIDIALIISSRLYNNLLPEEYIGFNEYRGEYISSKPKEEYHVFSHRNHDPDKNNKRIHYYSYDEVLYSRSRNLILLADAIANSKTFPEVQTVFLLESFYHTQKQYSKKIDGIDFIRNFKEFDNITNDLKTIFSNDINNNISPELQTFVISEINKIKQAHKNHYRIDESLFISNHVSEEKKKEVGIPAGNTPIPSLSMIKNKLSNLFNKDDNKENKLKK